MAENILVLAPHADDEVIGCGGMIARQALAGNRVHVAVAGLGGLYHRHLGRVSPVDERRAELERAAAVLGVARTTVLWEGLDMRLDTLPRLELVTRLDALLDETAYDQVYFPYASHNHDHRELYLAAYAALRTTANRCAPRLCAVYEYTYIGWTPDSNGIHGGRLYVDIGETLDVKVAAMKEYRSQIKKGNHPAGERAIRALAAMRGMESECEAAELFYVQRMIDRREGSQ